MRRPMDVPTGDNDRIADVVDLFAKSGTDGRSRGVHHLLGKLAKSDKGAVMAHLANVLLILAHDPPVAGMVGYNEFTSEHLMMRAPPPAEDGAEEMPGPYPRPWGPEDTALVQAYLQRIWAGRINLQTVEQAMMTVSRQNRFHPVRDWLGSLKWDGRSRIDGWLVNAFACKNTKFHRSIGSKFLIAAVRRIRRPGTKFDQLLVLEGEQGIGKSRTLEALFGREWFTDTMPDDLASRDAALALLGVWGLELGEIEQLIRSEVETVKAFLSRAVDRYRPPYGKSYVERPRQGVLIGTTNARDYLRDSTGNRRIWPVWCDAADPEWVRIHRDQLWAEAAHREMAGEAIWIENTEDHQTAVSAQAKRLTEDVWTDAIRTWSVGKIEMTTASVLSECLQIPRERQTRREQMRCAAILRAEGWDQSIESVGGKTTRLWKPKPKPAETPAEA